ncbi:MAG: ADP-heptose:LPS heptosyltransferase, partial [Arenicella sp.]
KGNESVLQDNPHLRSVLIWDKKSDKYKNLKILAKRIKGENYGVLLNLQRFASSGYLSWKSKAKLIVGFKKNPLSFSYHKKIAHEIGNGRHEIERNHDLLSAIGDFELSKPRLYPSQKQMDKIDEIGLPDDYVVMAPASVWETKRLPKLKWVELLNQLKDVKVFLIGSPSDEYYLSDIGRSSDHKNWVCSAGSQSLLESAYVISKASMTYVNDSAPLHLASAMNATVTAFFCSTIPEFGFGPLSDDSTTVEITEKLDCRPCGLHGKSSCPKGHFKCGEEIDVTIAK